MNLDSTGSQNLMLDEFLIIEEDKETGTFSIREANVGETGDQIEKKQLAQQYLEQLENSDKFDDLCGKLFENLYFVDELADEIKHNYYKCKSELLEWESICQDLEPALGQDNLDS